MTECFSLIYQKLPRVPWKTQHFCLHSLVSTWIVEILLPDHFLLEGPIPEKSLEALKCRHLDIIPLTSTFTTQQSAETQTGESYLILALNRLKKKTQCLDLFHFESPRSCGNLGNTNKLEIEMVVIPSPSKNPPWIYHQCTLISTQTFLVYFS